MRDTEVGARPDLSIVVPLFNEELNVRPLIREIRDALGDERPWELLLVDDGSTDDTRQLIEASAKGDSRIRGVILHRNYGQTAAMQAGFDHARAPVIVSLDGDLQNDPRDIPLLLAKLEEGYELVVGWRKDRKDPFVTRRLPSLIANGLIGWVTRVPIRDAGCTLKAFRRELLEVLRFYGDQHRFIAAIAASHGARIVEIPVQHHSRRFGESKYGLSRTMRVLLDLVTVRTLLSHRRRPRLPFGFISPLVFALSLLFLAGWVVAVLTFRPVKADSLVFPGAALLWAGTGLYLLMLGLLAEVAMFLLGRRSRAQLIVRELRP